MNRRWVLVSVSRRAFAGATVRGEAAGEALEKGHKAAARQWRADAYELAGRAAVAGVVLVVVVIGGGIALWFFRQGQVRFASD